MSPKPIPMIIPPKTCGISDKSLIVIAILAELRGSNGTDVSRRGEKCKTPAVKQLLAPGMWSARSKGES